MVNRKTTSALTIAALLACAIPIKSVASALVLPGIPPIAAQTAPTFPLPTAVPENTAVRISSGSDNMNAISEALRSGFEGDYANSEVSITTKSADQAIQDVLNDNADLAAISRPLTTEEKAQGLIEVPVRREKIAIIVGSNNPFAQSITGSQFAQIFRGEIKDWSEVGGSAGPIKLVDRPASSETRQALEPYPVFTTAPFEAAGGATTVDADTTEAVVKALGADGISYVLVGELEGQPEIKALQLHKTPPSDPRYPFSQPYSFVYAGGASPAVSAFLGYATGNPGQAVVNDAGVSGTGLIPDATNGVAAAGTATGTSAGNAATGNAATGDVAAGDAAGSGAAEGQTNGGTAGTASNLGAEDTSNAGAASDTEGTTPGADGTTLEANGAGADGTGAATADGAEAGAPDGVNIENGAADLGGLSNRGRWWWLLLPLAGLGLLIWAAGKRGKEEETGYITNADQSDRIQSAYETERVGAGVGVGRPEVGVGRADIGGTVEGTGLGKAGLGKMAAGGAALAGGAAAAGTGIAGRMGNQASDLASGLKGGVSGTVGSGIEGVRGGFEGAKGNLEGLKSSAQGGLGNIREGIDGVRGSASSGLSGMGDNVRGGIDGVRGAAGDMADSAQDRLDALKGNAQSNIDGATGTAKASGESWLDRAKQRINEATDQIKDTATDAKDNITNRDQ
ncbi:MAG: substrate-binding domain-containing protein [Cyanobacteria bacterium J06623_4]